MRIPRIKSLSSHEQTSQASDTSTQASAQTDREHTLLAVSLRIWATTLIILALPVLGIATFQVATIGKTASSSAAEPCQTSMQSLAKRFVAQDRLPGSD